MKSYCALLVVVCAATCARPASAYSGENPLGTVIELMDSLAAKVTADGVAEEKAFNEYKEWCDEVTQKRHNEIKTAQTKKAELEAAIGKATSDSEASGGKIEDVAGMIAQAESELADSKVVREKEAADFSSAEGELTETINMLERAIGIIEKEMAKNPAAFMQLDTSSMQGLISSLSAVVDAAAFNAVDKQKLIALVQGQQRADDEDVDAPDPAAYKSHSTGILDVLEDLKAKAEEQLSGIRKAESSAKHNYAMLKQSLADQKSFDTKKMSEEKAFRAESEEAKATASAELSKTTQLLENSKASLTSVQASCMQTASDHVASAAGRAQELKTIADAKKILMDTSAGAVAATYSFLQQKSGSVLQTSADLNNAEVVRFVKKLAQDQHSKALAQLASKIAALTQFGAAAGEDPFVKVKGLIADMIAKLEAEADAAATEKAYCDEQIAKTEAKKSELEDDMAKLTAKIDTKSATSTQLKEEVKELQEELAALANEQAELSHVRAEENAAFTKTKADLELGLTGVRNALGVLRKYYQGAAASMIQAGDEQPAQPVFHSQASGAGGSIIDILEVVESDFAKNLAQEDSEEADANGQFEKMSQEMKVSAALKSQSVKYKTQEFKSLDKDVNELIADRTSTDTELNAVLEYYGKVKDRCIAAPETYEQRASRRQVEIKGLKEALAILSSEVAPSLLQGRKRAFRTALAP